MTKAEERAFEAYPNDKFVDDTYAEMCRSFYIEGYKQAVVDACGWLKLFGESFVIRDFLTGLSYSKDEVVRDFREEMEK